MTTLSTYRPAFRPGLLGRGVFDDVFDSFINDFPQHIKRSTQGYPVADIYTAEDGSTTVYDISNDADVNHSTLTKSDTKVFIDGVETTAYTITQGSDSTIKAINLTVAASQKSKIDIGVLQNADYNFSSSTVLNITGGTFTGDITFNLDANLFGPKTLILFFSRKSTIPHTSGSSGPTITRLILFFGNFTYLIKISRFVINIKSFIFLFLYSFKSKYIPIPLTSPIVTQISFLFNFDEIIFMFIFFQKLFLNFIN